MKMSTRLRFEILLRDGFRCRYCGSGPAQARLTVDHVVPVVAGGLSHPANLVTACEGCNAGKSAARGVEPPEHGGEAYVLAAPVDAPEVVLSQVGSETAALQVMVEACGLPQFAIAGATGISEGYFSRLLSGKRDIPHALIGPLCAATGSNLLRQYIELERALNGRQSDVCRLAEMLRGAA